MNEEMGKRIRKRRLSLKIGATALARKVGVSRNYIHQIEAGDRHGAGELLGKIAHELQTTTDYLLGNTEDWQIPEGVGLPVPELDIAPMVNKLNALPAPKRKLITRMFDLLLQFSKPAEYPMTESLHPTAQERSGLLADLQTLSVEELEEVAEAFERIKRKHALMAARRLEIIKSDKDDNASSSPS